MVDEIRALLLGLKSQEAMTRWWENVAKPLDPTLQIQGNSPWCHVGLWQRWLKKNGLMDLRAGFDRSGRTLPSEPLDIEKEIPPHGRPPHHAKRR